MLRDFVLNKASWPVSTAYKMRGSSDPFLYNIRSLSSWVIWIVAYPVYFVIFATWSKS